MRTGTADHRGWYNAPIEREDIIAKICDEADDFLAGVFQRDEAKAGIAEWLTIHHAALPPADKKSVIDQSMRLLEIEGFFEREPGGG